MTLRLGKQEHQYDELTLMLSDAISPTVVFPHKFSTDAHRAPFPLRDWGNRAWGNCVKAAQVNQILRTERVEQRRTLPFTDEMVVEEYKKQTGAQSPGDANDTGLVMLYNNRLWRTEGFPLKTHAYKIAAFGELHVEDLDQLRAAVFLFRGIQLGLALPLTARDQTELGTWDVVPNNGPDSRPNSWGGHAVYCQGYDEDGFDVKSWGFNIRVTNDFMLRYCDEAWGVVDDFNTWKKRKSDVDIQKVIQHLRDIGASGIE